MHAQTNTPTDIHTHTQTQIHIHNNSNTYNLKITSLMHFLAEYRDSENTFYLDNVVKTIRNVKHTF